MKIPYRLTIMGETWRVRWGDATGELMDARKDFGCCVDADRLIILNPSIRKNRLLAAEVLAHEIQHAFNAVAKRRRVKGWIEIPHAAIHRYEVAWGAFFVENGLTFGQSVVSQRKNLKSTR